MKRKTIVNILVAVFAVLFIALASIAAIIIAQGKKIDGTGQLVETSIIRINSFPSDVKAFVNDKVVDIVDSKIENIDAGVVKLKLVKDGYVPWEKDITIGAGVVEDVYAQLYPQSIDFEKTVTSSIDKVFYSNDFDYIFYTVLNSKNITENGIWKIKLSKNLLDFGVNKPFQINNFSIIEVEQVKRNNYELKISNDNNKVMLVLPEDTQIFLYNADNVNVKDNLNELLGFYPDKVEWFRNSDSIILAKDDLLFEYELGTKQTTLVDYGTEKPKFAVTSSLVYFIRNGKVFKYLNKSSSEIEFSSKLQDVTGKANAVYSVFNSPNLLIIESEKGLVYADFDREFIDLIDTKGSFIAVSSLGKSVLFNKDGYLYTYKIDDTLDAKSYTSAAYNINIKSDTVEKIEFSAGGNNILSISNDKKIVLMDFDGQNKRNFLDDFKLAQSDVLLSKNNTEVYALMEDKAEDNTPIRNIFKFNLEVK